MFTSLSDPYQRWWDRSRSTLARFPRNATGRLRLCKMSANLREREREGGRRKKLKTEAKIWHKKVSLIFSFTEAERGTAPVWIRMKTLYFTDEARLDKRKKKKNHFFVPMFIFRIKQNRIHPTCWVSIVTAFVRFTCRKIEAFVKVSFKTFPKLHFGDKNNSNDFFFFLKDSFNSLFWDIYYCH